MVAMKQLFLLGLAAVPAAHGVRKHRAETRTAAWLDAAVANGTTGAFTGAAAEALTLALQVVGKSGSEDLRAIVDSFEPTYMVAGGTSQAKDSLMMMLMGLPYAFQGAGIATRVPVLYRLFKTAPGTKMEVSMRFEDGLGNDGPVPPENVVKKIEEHMGKYSQPKPGRFGEKPIVVLVSGPDLQGSVYKNMMGRVVGSDPQSRENSAVIDKIYDFHSAASNTMLVAVEKSLTSPQNSMISPFASKLDPYGDRTIWVKTWADYGIVEKNAESGKPCSEVQEYFREMDFKKPNGSAATFWIPTVEAEKYLTDTALTFEERITKLEDAILKKENKMSKFILDWEKKNCIFEFSAHTKVTQMRQHLSELHQKKVTERLPELVSALEGQKTKMDTDLAALQQRLDSLPGGDSPSSELREVVDVYKALFDEQWIGERLPPAIGLSEAEIMKIQRTEFDMTATDMATALLASWKKEGGKENQDSGFDRRLIEVANMLSYPSAKQQLTISGHFWTHLTNIFMLIVRSLKDLIVRRELTHNFGNVGMTGPSLCNSAAREAKETFITGVSEKGHRLMSFSIRWLLQKHVAVTRKLLMAMPRNKAYADDKQLNKDLLAVEKSFLDEWQSYFSSEYKKFLRMVSINVQQGKIMKMLNAMDDEEKNGGSGGAKVKSAPIIACTDITGAENRTGGNFKMGKKPELFPLCKCDVKKEDVFCGIEKVAERKFNATEVKEHSACAYSTPYCSKEAMQHDLRDLAVLLNPTPSNCTALYDELVDSSVDMLVLNVGSLMYYMLYDTGNPIRKSPDFASKLFQRLKKQYSDKVLSKHFPSMGQRAMVAEKIVSLKDSISDLNRAKSFFERAMMQR